MLTNCFLSDLKIGDYFALDTHQSAVYMCQVTSISDTTLTAIDIAHKMSDTVWWEVKPERKIERVFRRDIEGCQYSLVSKRRENQGTDTNLKTGKVKPWIEIVYRFELTRTWDDWRVQIYVQKLSSFIDTCLSYGQSVDEVFESLDCYQSALTFSGSRVLRTLHQKYHVYTRQHILS